MEPTHAQQARDALMTLLERGERVLRMLDRTDDEASEEAAVEAIGAVGDLAAGLIHTGLAIAESVDELTNATVKP